MLLDTGSARLLIDPGTWSEGFEDLTGLDAVLITHQHVDHLDSARLPALLRGNQGAQLIAGVVPAEQQLAAGARQRPPSPVRCSGPSNRDL